MQRKVWMQVINKRENQPFWGLPIVTIFQKKPSCSLMNNHWLNEKSLFSNVFPQCSLPQNQWPFMVSHLLNTAFKEIALKISFNILCPQQHALLFVCLQWHKTEPNKLQNSRALCPLLFVFWASFIFLIYSYPLLPLVPSTFCLQMSNCHVFWWISPWP